MQKVEGSSPFSRFTRLRTRSSLGAATRRQPVRLSYAERVSVRRMDNVGIVVEDLSASVDFFRELGLELEGRADIEGEWAGRVTGLGEQHVEIAMMRTPDGHSRIELSRFLTPAVVADHRNAPVNASSLPARHVCRGRPRRDARPAPQARRRAGKPRSGPVPGRVSA